MKLSLVATGLLAKQYPFFQECAEGTFDDIAFEDFYASLKETKASLIRIDSDSLTYPLHIIIRYEIEKCYLMVLWKSLICQKCGTKIPRVLRRIT